MINRLKKIKVIILLTALSLSLVSCGSIVNNKSELNNADNIEEKVNDNYLSKDKEEDKKIETIKLNQSDVSAIKYNVIGKENYNNDILFQKKYSDLEGVLCFRGNNYRNGASYGVSNLTEKKLEQSFKFTTGSRSWGGGAGWTGQPAIVKWPEDMKNKMNIYDEFKKKKDFTEVIYASIDGCIYFLDLDTGKRTRDKIDVGNPIKGSLSIDPRGLPLLYTGEGIVEKGTVGFNIYSLLDGKKLYEVDGMDNDCYRKWPAFDGSCLVFAENDTIIEGGENGLVYIIKLNSNYDKDKNTIKIDPKITKYKYAIGDNYTRLGIENSVACYGNLLYFADNSGNIQCLDLNTMKPMWLSKGKDDTDATITLEVEDDVPYLYTGDEVDLQGSKGTCTIRKINGFTGEVVWKKDFECFSIVGKDPVNGGLMATNVIGKNKMKDKVIFSIARYKNMQKGVTLALNKKTGEIEWQCDFDNYMWSSPVDFYDKDGSGYIIQCDSIGNMFLLDGENGKVLNKIHLDANIEASPAVFNDKAVVATRGGNIYGINIK